MFGSFLECTQLGLETAGEAHTDNNNSMGEAAVCALRLHNITPLEEILRVRVRVRVRVSVRVRVRVRVRIRVRVRVRVRVRITVTV